MKLTIKRALACLGIVAAMAVAGAIEDPAHAAVLGDRDGLFASEWAGWQSLSKADHRYYCSMGRHHAVTVWLDSMSEGAEWQVSHELQARVARLVIRRGCNPYAGVKD